MSLLRPIRPTTKVSLLIAAFVAISGAWAFTSNASNASTAQSASKASTATWQFQGPTSQSQTVSLLRADTRSAIQNDTPATSGPPTLFWSESGTQYRAVHDIAVWNASSKTWSAISPDLTQVNMVGSPGYGTDGITAVAHRGSIWYVGTLSGDLTVKRGVKWMSVIGGLPQRTISAIALPPGDSKGNQAVIGFGKTAANANGLPGNVYLTTDGGQHWTNLSGNLPNQPVQSIHFTRNQAASTLLAEVNNRWYQMQQPGTWSLLRTSAKSGFFGQLTKVFHSGR